MTKDESLAKMNDLRACDAAIAFVRDHESDDAETIWRSCNRVDWLCWYAFRVRPELAPAFALECADRAVRTYAPKALRRAGLTVYAERLEALPPIVDRETANAANAAAVRAADAA